MAVSIPLTHPAYYKNEEINELLLTEVWAMIGTITKRALKILCIFFCSDCIDIFVDKIKAELRMS